MTEKIRLTQYSHGAGCGCKLSPAVLGKILANQQSSPDEHERLLVGNDSSDDAGAYDLGNGTALLTTTDFFMPIVDDPFEFGRIASANAISDIYAMGGNPVMAIAILGWPVDKIEPEVAGEVIAGARSICAEAGVALAGGHSIDSPEPIFGLSVNGLVDIKNLKRNDSAKAADVLFLTKAVGIGILSTAEKRGLLKDEHKGIGARSMMQLNSVGAQLAKIEGVNAMTDVTGFGLLGHLGEMAEGSELNATINVDKVKLLTDLDYYLEKGAIPGGTKRNLESYNHRLGKISDRNRWVLADPQTSGGLLISVSPHGVKEVQKTLVKAGLDSHTEPIGTLSRSQSAEPRINVV